jgi:ubiquilin
MSDAASPTEQLPGTISVLVKSSSGAVETVSGLDRASTSVADLKALLAARPSGVPAEAQRLIYKGRVMKDDMTLEHYGIHLPALPHSYHVISRAKFVLIFQT